MKVQKGSTNVYADLGMPDAEEMLIKAQLATKIGQLISRRKLVQQQAAKLLDISQPKLSNLLRGNFRGISEVKMIECLTLLGSDVSIVVKSRSAPRSVGHLSVVFA
jgi:predicted XRE-type DNA-binding protein